MARGRVVLGRGARVPGQGTLCRGVSLGAAPGRAPLPAVPARPASPEGSFSLTEVGHCLALPLSQSASAPTSVCRLSPGLSPWCSVPRTEQTAFAVTAPTVTAAWLAPPLLLGTGGPCAHT